MRFKKLCGEKKQEQLLEAQAKVWMDVPKEELLVPILNDKKTRKDI